MKMQIEMSKSLHDKLIELGLEAMSEAMDQITAKTPAAAVPMHLPRTYTRRKKAKKAKKVVAKPNGHALDTPVVAKSQAPVKRAWTPEHRRNFLAAMRKRRGQPRKAQ